MEPNILTIATNTFGLNLFKIIRNDLRGKNVFMSPWSISAALSMTSLGARENTAQQMAQVLGWKTEDGEMIHKLFQVYLTALKKPSELYNLMTANRIYMECTFNIKEEFKSKTKEWYLAEPVQANFKEDANGEAAKINSWVEKQTQDKIKDLFVPGILNSDTKMVLVNAIYFKGDWDIKFKEHCTESRPFKLAPGQTIEVPTMYSKDDYGFYKDDNLNFAAIELLYKGGDLSMIIILPNEDFGLEDIVSKLTAETLNNVIKGITRNEIVLYLPKFKITSSLQLKEPLSSLGMTDAFTSNADFTGVTSQRDLSVTKVVHKAFVNVNEQGTEAAAATGFSIELMCMKFPFAELIVDHPFLFAIIDKREKGSLLFLGQVDNPSV